MMKLKSAFVAIAILFNYSSSVVAQDKVTVSFLGNTAEPVALFIIIIDPNEKPPIKTTHFKAKLPYTKVLNVSEKAHIGVGSLDKYPYKMSRNGKPCMEVVSTVNDIPDNHICRGKT